jgi:hypothetical protein
MRSSHHAEASWRNPWSWGPRRGGGSPAARQLALRCLLLAAAAAALAPASASAQAAGPGGETVGPESPRHVWLDADGAPLPFQSDDEILEFLRTADVVSQKTTESGVTRPSKLLLERDGVRAHAILRWIDDEKRRTRIGERFYIRFVDRYASECAAYVLARQIGLDFVPPAVLRKVGRNPGSVQIWVEKARDETAADFRPPSPVAWVKQVWDQDLFDNLILNVDRNASNILVGDDYTLWAIDHTRAFQPQAQLLSPEKLEKINRAVWDRLGAIGDDELKDLVREYLDTEQLNTLVQRRALLAEHVQRLVTERGGAAVFY